MNKPTKYSIALLAILTLSNADTTDLGEIEIISANKTKQSIKKTTSNVTVITEEDIKQNGYTSLPEALSHSTGLHITQNGGMGTISSIFVRGMSSGSVLIMVDGMRLNDPSEIDSKAWIESIPISNVAQIEIIRGGSSSIWGANASSGVINIITKKSQQDGISGDIGINLGAHKTKGIDTNIFYNKNGLSAKLMGSALNVGGISALAPQKSEKDKYKNRNFVAGLGYEFNEDTKANITFNKTFAKGDYDTGSANDPLSNFDNTSTNINGEFVTKIGDIKTVLRASQGEYERIDTNPYGQSVYSADIKEYTLLNEYQYKIGSTVFGVEYKDLNGNSPFVATSANDNYTNKAAFLSNTIQPTDKLLLEANLRYDVFDKFDNKTTYKLGVKYDLTREIKVRANYYTSFNAPSVYQLANALNAGSLKPSYIKGYDASIYFKNNVTLTYFDNKIEDDIIYISNWPNPGPSGYANNSATENIRGIEFAFATPTYFDALNFRGNWTHLIDLNDKAGKKLLSRPKDDVNIFADYIYSDTFVLSLGAEYVGTKYSSGYSESIGNYTLWNANMTKKIGDNIDLGLHFKNIFDKEYQSVYGYNSEGRTLEAKLTYKF